MSSISLDSSSLWRFSSVVYDDESALKNLYKRARFVWRGRKVSDAAARVINAPRAAAFRQILARTPRLSGLLEWPFLNAKFEVEQRFRCVVEHAALVDERWPCLALDPNASLLLLDLGAEFSGLTLIAENAPWFIREGCLNFSLMLDGKRLMSLSFSLGTPPNGGGLICRVGSIQGYAESDAIDHFKALADVFNGVRPRDFIFKAFRLWMQVLNVPNIDCVADSHRIQNHPFFGTDKAAQLHLRYDDIWEEQGGERNDQGFYSIPSDIPERPLTDVPQKKRGRYKRRQEMLASMRDGLHKRWLLLAPSVSLK